VDQEKTKVLIVGLNYLPEPTGIAPYTTGLASGLKKQGWFVRVVTTHPHYPAWKISPGYDERTIWESIDSVPVLRVRPFMPRNPSGLKRLWLEVWFGVRATFARWGNPDVVILVSPALFASAIALIKARLLPGHPAVVVWVQDLYSLGVAETGALGGVGARVMGWIESHTLRGADTVVAIHERFRRYMVSSLGVDVEKVAVVRNWTHLKHVEVDRLSYREKFSWGDDIVVLHAGNMGAKQALENVVQAARLADLAGSAVKFVLVGNGNQRELLRALGDGVRSLIFMDSLDDADFQGAMAAADILLVNEKPGVTEMAVPSKLTSYFAAARPVIAATDAGSITAEEVAAAAAGVRVNAGDPQGLLDAVIVLGSDVQRSEEYGANGAEFQRRVLSPSAAISHYAEIISILARERGL
jgi:colanic acid biosynthesis glycosyl transferase WcaI